MAETFNDWKSALTHAAGLQAGGAISQRELNDIKTQARQAGMFPVGSTVFDNWDHALSHAIKLHGNGALTSAELENIKRSAQSPRVQQPDVGAFDRIRSFLSNFQGPGTAY